MIRLHCTKKLLAKLPLDDVGRIRNPKPYLLKNNTEEESALTGWHANLLVLQRRQCVLLVHDATRFPVFIPALKKDDFANLDYLFVDCFMNTLLKTGVDDVLMQAAHAALGPLVCDTECNRSVHGTMNQMAQDLEWQLAYRRVSVGEIAGYRVSANFADRPCTVKGVKDCIWPKDAMRQLLQSLVQSQ